MNNKGVTLVELVVVFVIIAIGATLAVPTIGAWTPRYRIRSAARDIVSKMREAQMKAVANNTSCRVSFNAAEAGAANSFILQCDTGGIFISDGAPQTLPDGITMNLNLDNGRAVFNSDCTCTNDTKTLTLSYIKGGITKEQKTIRVKPTTGRVIVD